MVNMGYHGFQGTRLSTSVVQFVLICLLSFEGGCVRFGFSSSSLVNQKDGGSGTDVFSNDLAITDRTITDKRLASSEKADAGIERKDLDLKQDKGSLIQDQRIIADMVIQDAKPPLLDISRDIKTGDILIPISWVKIPAGTFMMGSPAEEPCRSSDENQHQVKLTNAFEMTATKVTFNQYISVVAMPSYASEPPNFPAPIYWDQAAFWCNALSEKQKLPPCYLCKTETPATFCSAIIVIRCNLLPEYSHEKIYQCPGYRLPTEAEWEYAYRAGTTTSFYNGDITSCSGQDPLADEIGWYSKNSKEENHEVRQKKPNAFGLYDIAGERWEWINDAYQEDLGTDPVENPFGAIFSPELAPCERQAKVSRGGSNYLSAQYMRAAQRSSFPGSDTHPAFRCVRTLPP